MAHEKQLLLDEITRQMDQADAFLIAQYTKVTAIKANEFRKTMRGIGGNFEVVKKRVFLKALEKAGIKLELSAMPGHIGIIFAGKDAIDTTKAVIKFSKDNEEAFALVGAKVDGQMISAQDVAYLSKLPGKDQMRAEFLGLLEAPMAQTLSVMDALLTSVVHCIDNKAKAE
jgi:large subunit ribosomal protein L10